jgi:hypothetical protein
MNLTPKSFLTLYLIAALAVLPPEILSALFNWTMLDWQYLCAGVLWVPAACWIQLLLFRQMGRLPVKRSLTRAVWSSLNGQLLLGLRMSQVFMLGWLPAFMYFSLFWDLTPRHNAALLLLVLLGGIPSLLYVLRRLLFPLFILTQGLNAVEALAESSLLTRGQLKLLLSTLLPWLSAALGLELLKEILPAPAGLILLPVSELLTCLGLLKAWDRLKHPLA